MAKSYDSVRFITGEARFLWPSLFTARTPQNRKSATPIFDVEMLFAPSTDMSGAFEAAKKAALAAWPGANLTDGSIRFPFRKGDQHIQKTVARYEREGKKVPDLSHYEGTVILRPKSQTRPKVYVMAAGTGDLVEIINEADVYGGCYGFAEVSFKAYDGNDDDIKPGVTAYLEGVVKTRDGDRIGGRDNSALQAMAKSIRTHVDVNMDDEIPF